MSIFQIPAPVLATGSRVTWQGIPATVIDGNEANEWRPASALVSLHLDRPVRRGCAPYADVQASSIVRI